MMKSCLVLLLCFTLAAVANGLQACSGLDRSWCPDRVEQGYCTSRVSFMTMYCGAACGFCIGKQNVDVDVSACLGAHNAKRNLHVDTPNLVWDATLAAKAAESALTLATTNTLKADSTIFGYYGENLYKVEQSSVSNCEEAVTSWYNQINEYNYNSPGLSEKTKYFTQLVWRSTTRVGVGVATAPHNGNLVTVVVARFFPAGNKDGQFQDNVLQLKKPKY